MRFAKQLFHYALLAPILVATSSETKAGIIYWGEVAGSGVQVYSANIDGTNKQTVALFPNKDKFHFDIDAAGRKIYAVSATPHDPISLFRANLDGTGLELLSNSSDFGTLPYSMVRNPENGDIYVQPHTLVTGTPGSAPGGMQRVIGNGSTIETLAPKPWYAHDMEVDTVGDKVYYTEDMNFGAPDAGFGSSGIRRMNYDGTGDEQVLSDFKGLQKFIALDLSNDQIYYSASVNHERIYRYSLSTGVLSTAFSTPGLTPYDVDLMPRSGKLIYYGTTPTGYAIQTANPVNGAIETSFETGAITGFVFVESATVPEPTSLAIFGALGIVGITKRRGRKKKTA